MSDGGNPFRNAADGHSHLGDRDSTYEENLAHMDFCAWERILDVASRDRSFDPPPPKMIVFTSQASPSLSAKKDFNIPKVVIPKSAYNCHRRSESQRKLYEDDELPSDMNQWSPKRLVMCGVQHNEVVRMASGVSTKPSLPQHEGLPHFSYADRTKTIHHHKVHSQESQSQRQWYLDDEMPPGVNRWSPKRLMCGMQDNEMVMVHMAPELSKKPYPPERVAHPRNGLHSLSCQEERKTSRYGKIHVKERIDDNGRSLPLGCKSHPMNRWGEEKSANASRSISRKQWYERADSMKGKSISNTPYSMEIVLFKKVGEGPPVEDGGQSCID